LCFDDWTDLQRCRLGRQAKGVKGFVVSYGQVPFLDSGGWECAVRSQRIGLEILIGLAELKDEFVVVLLVAGSVALWSWFLFVWRGGLRI
jgi:hypothetical protein